ncbi:MAG: lysylphosphatidylglycerol synthase domain-containing protein [Candidatus Daviesbacteria bacterium]|nr:lysylphosphatidylglycerol synthase domain-containing protein [Candidatus Daviesbacteria bacterium]
MKKLISPILVIFIFGILILTIVKNWPQLSSLKVQIDLFSLVLIIFLTLAIFPINIISWHLITKSQKLDISLSKNLNIWIFSNLSRFLPGGIWQYPSRVLLLSKEGINKLSSSAIVIMEALFILLVVFLIVWLSLFLNLLPVTIDQRIFISGSVVILVLFYLLFNNAMLNKIISFFSNTFLKKDLYVEINLSLKWFPLLVLFFLLQFIVSGSILFLISKSMVDLPVGLLPTFISLFTISWFLGYITFFAPSGLGVQEISLAGSLSLFMPFPVASLIVIVFRILVLLSEALVVLLTAFFLKRK